MFYRHKRTKVVREVNGNSPEGREMAKSDDWDRIESGTVDEDEQMPAGVVQPPEPVVTVGPFKATDSDN